MIGTERSALALTVAVHACLTWAAGVVLGGTAAVVMAVVAGVVPLADFVTTDAEIRSTERRARTALREHRDPGPDVRPEVDHLARRRLGRGFVDRWVPLLLLPGIAVACVVVAVVRADVLVALPALPLVVLAVFLVFLVRRADARARRWLADPPFARDVDA